MAKIKIYHGHAFKPGVRDNLPVCVAATSREQVAKALNCSTYYIKNYFSVVEPTTRKLHQEALRNPGKPVWDTFFDTTNKMRPKIG